jgi:hypothetical protein
LRSHQTAQATILTLVYKMKIRALLGRPCELTAWRGDLGVACCEEACLV